MPEPKPLVPVDDFKEAWPHGELEFSSWLAAQENLDLFGESLGIDIENVTTEHPVGTMRADIVGTDTTHGSVAFIENQIKESDHDHLGKVLTYAGYDVGEDNPSDPVTLVWVAKRFRPEHRSTLNWLNAVTDDHVRIYGVEVKLWKITGLDIGYQFLVVVKPKESPLKVLSDGLGYWAGLNEYLTEHDLPRLGAGAKVEEKNFNQRGLGKVGTASCVLRVTKTPNRGSLRIAMFIGGRDEEMLDAFAIGRYLAQRKTEIENQLGHETDLVQPNKEKPIRKSATLSVTRHGFDLSDTRDLNRQYEWISERLKEFDELYQDRIKDVNPKTISSNSETASSNGDAN